MGRNRFIHGPRAKPRLAEQVHLGLAWNAELGRGKKIDGEWNRTGANRQAG
jgi:hypothetical protein